MCLNLTVTYVVVPFMLLRAARSLRLGVPSLRDRSGRSAYGLLRCTSSRWVWLRQTVAALPPPGSIPPLSLPMSPYRSKAAAELTLILLSGEERVFGFGFVVDSPLTPALSRGRGSRFAGFSRSEFNAVLHVGVPSPNTSVKSPLPPGEG